jgi:hypothetical protein
VTPDAGKSVPDLLGDLVNQTTTLVRKEVQLARAELGEKVGVVGGAATSLAIGAGLLLGALFALTYALIALLVELFGLSETVSAFIVAAVFALVGFLVLRGGLAKLENFNLTPDRTVAQLSRDAQVVKEQVR